MSRQEKLYSLFVKVGSRWEWIRDIRANSHQQAYGQAMVDLRPEHYEKPIRVELQPAAVQRPHKRTKRQD